MSKIIEGLFYSKLGQSLMSAVGVKTPHTLKRYEGEVPWVMECVLLVRPASDALNKVLEEAHIANQIFNADINDPCGALLFDATELETIEQLETLKSFFSQAAKRLPVSGRIVIIGKSPTSWSSLEQASIMDALNGFTRAYAKELGPKGITVNLVYVEGCINASLTTPLCFLLSHKASYITGQPIYIKHLQALPEQDSNWQAPLSGKLALVTGAAQGIGAAIAKTLSRDGATVIGLDIPNAKLMLEATMASINGQSLTTDITNPHAFEDIQTALNGRSLDILVHNAGVTRDKTLAKMPEHFWSMTLDINLNAPIQITQALDKHQMLSPQARVICISSISGIAGNVGQTNYAASKSGIAGFVRQQAQHWNDTGKTINAIAPGFIETQMTDQIPFVTREMGRRMNSLSQGGQPQDVAEGVALFAQPNSYGLNGQLLRVCGQSLIGA